ncbi:MAG: TrbI/VirB10 family protein [Treponema sp.]|uniref:TrbI/VirB10 family protein n=1 Tax=Treponema sp. TaxID=166 RepID=UPI0025D6EA5C|nr:TrbI/VirB10 family protein [Treponema sp.]MBQ8680094.1 TrbI/VirB10 family protein [Treponema sp.]
MDEKDNGSGELGSVFGSILNATDKSAEDLASLAAGNGGIAEVEIQDTAPDSGSGLSFEDTISGEASVSPRTDWDDGTGNPAAPENGAGGAFSTEKKNADEVKPFQPKKMSARDAMSGKKTPQTLNKQLILYCIVGIAAFAVIFAVIIFPFLTKKRVKSASERPVASENQVTDYSKLVESYGKGKSDLDEEPEPKEKIPQKNDDEIMDSLPPVNEKYRPKDEQQSQPVYYASGSSYSYEIPDTRSDSLQSKTINGIKGLTSTQKNYMTSDSYAPGTGNPSSAGASSGGISYLTGDGDEGSAGNPYARFGLPADKNAYASQLLGQYNQTNNSYAQQNDQSGKNSFYNQNRGNVFGQWLPLNSVWQGTIFDVTLTSDISTDLPGECTAVVTKNVYSSQDGRYLLIPQNSKLLGSYNSSISYSQSRVQVGWHTLIRPDGYMVNLGNFNATDTKGASGLKGAINDHPFAYLKAIALMSAVNIVNSELQATAASSANEYVQNVMANSQEVATTLGSKLIDRAMDVQPTITIKAGTNINIVANTTLELPPLEPWEVTEPYHRK